MNKRSMVNSPWSMVIPMCLCVVTGCLSISEKENLNQNQPRVIYVFPEETESVLPATDVILLFSHSVDPEGFEDGGFSLVEGEVSWDKYEGAAKWISAIEDGDVSEVAGEGSLTEDGLVYHFKPGGDLKWDQQYSVVVTGRVMTEDKLPLTQTPGEATEPFIYSFRTREKDGAGTNIEVGDSGTGEEGDSAEKAGVEAIVRPERCVINEVLYDAEGSDTDGQVFIELFCSNIGNISGYQIVFVNGEDGLLKGSIVLPETAEVGEDGLFVIADSKTGSSDETFALNADWIANFDPQNGPDAVQLIDAVGNLLDVVAYGEGVVATAENGLAAVEGTPALDVASGHSIKRKIDGEDTNNNGVDFIDGGIGL